MKPEVQIAGRNIGPGRPVYIVAELSANHLGSFERAVRLVEEAHRAGADAVKLQTYTADTLTLDSDRPCFRIEGGSAWDGRTLHDLYSEAAMPWEWQPRLKEMADGLGIDLFSTPFDPSAVDFLLDMDVPAFKVASFELVDLPLLSRVAATGRPLVLSTGMATAEEIDEAVAAVAAAGGEELVLLKCTSAYPAEPETMHLRTIPDLANRFAVPVGLSDHSMDAAVPVAAVALGACFLEKHLTLSRSEPGPDSHFSLEPDEFRRTVETVRLAERALGEVRYGPQPHEALSLSHRRSLFVVQNIARGERFSPDNVRSIRPADGLPPKHVTEVLGRRAARDLEQGTPLAWSDIEGAPGPQNEP